MMSALRWFVLERAAVRLFENAVLKLPSFGQAGHLWPILLKARSINVVFLSVVLRMERVQSFRENEKEISSHPRLIAAPFKIF